MGLLKNRAPSEFCQIPNALIVDSRLSMGARILYCYLRGKPDGWKVYNGEIAKSLQINPDTVTKYWKELLTSGWISREKQRDQAGNFSGGYDYEIHYTPILQESEKTPFRENHYLGETSEHINKEKTSNTEKTNNISKPSKPVARKRSLLQIFSNAVIDDFESQIQTDVQKEVWFKRNCRNLKDILAYCNNDLEAAMFTIDCTIDWLSSHNLQGGYEAVCRNLPEMYSRAMKRINNGARWNFSPEIRSQIDNLRQDCSKQDNSMAKKNQQALRAIFKEI